VETTFKLKQGVEFRASTEDVKSAAKRMPSKKERPNGYFVEIDGEYFRMKSVLKQLASDKGFDLRVISKAPLKRPVNGSGKNSIPRGSTSTSKE